MHHEFKIEKNLFPVFESGFALSGDLLSFLASFLQAKNLAQEKIGPMDGVYYEVQSSEIVYKQDAVNCGFNDVGAANQGRFRRERRHYTEYSNGTSLRTWYGTVDVFLDCYQP